MPGRAGQAGTKGRLSAERETRRIDWGSGWVRVVEITRGDGGSGGGWSVGRSEQMSARWRVDVRRPHRNKSVFAREQE